MTLEEADKQLLSEQCIMVNTVGENELIVQKLISDIAARSYFVASVKTPKGPSGFNRDELGEYSTLKEVKNHFLTLSFASDIDVNGWVISPEKGDREGEALS